MLKRRLTGMFFLFLVCCFYQESFAQNRKKPIKVVGRVVAIDDSVGVSDMPLSHDLVVRIVNRIQGDEQATYVKVIYQPLHGQKGLPREMWSGQNRWGFTLHRATDEDEICKEAVNGWIRTKPETGQFLPDFEKLTCYLLSPGDFKLSNKR